MNRIVIGLVGPISSGKGIIADYLRSTGFTHYSLSDRIREELAVRGLTENRTLMQDVGDELRSQDGFGELAKRTAILIRERQQAGNLVIESIRHPDEASYLIHNLNTVLVGVTASVERRFELCLSRGRAGDPKTLAGFMTMDYREFKGGRKGEIDIGGCLELARFVVENEEGNKASLINSFRREMEGVGINLEGIKKGGERLM